ncbi:ABC transporter permease [Clostridium sp. FP2]|uniref:ABC transporter permease subunit n=1 Tax=Clostridium sp. FP2 TaxID=2724481 RepID=UPI0013E90672|nr:ABC transporter permease subunit [Clostridium sp. FP2]MBZ9626344.1 ABC transporter permease [Clostridium sp. FP2]
MRLIAFEIRKLFCSKITLITVAAILIISSCMAISESHTWKKHIGDVDIFNKMVQPYEGKIDKKLASEINEKIEKKQSTSSDGYDTNSSLSYEERRKERFEGSYYSASNNAKMWKSDIYENADIPYTVTGLSNLCSTLEARGQKDSYLYSDTLKHVNMLKVVGEPGYYNTKGWSGLFLFIADLPGIIFISIILLMVISPIFSNESRNNMQRIILSTKNGLRKIVSAKIIASLVFTIAWVTLFYVVMYLLYLIPYGALTHGNIPLNSLYDYTYTPYNWTVVQALGVIYLTTLLSACTLATVFCLISSFQKKNLTSIACALMFVIAPMCIRDAGTIANVLILFPSSIMSGKVLFNSYISFNIMNTPIMYPSLAIIVLLLTSLVAILLTFKSYRRKIKA